MKTFNGHNAFLVDCAAKMRIIEFMGAMPVSIKPSPLGQNP